MAVFSDAMKATTINKRTFKLVKAGTTTSVSAKAIYNAATKKAMPNPSANLAPKTIYTVTVKRGSIEVKNTRETGCFKARSGSSGLVVDGNQRPGGGDA